MDRVIQYRGVLSHRAPLDVHDERHPVLVYTNNGKPDVQVYDTAIFPTDVMVVFTEAMDEPRVFLARDPHSGCLIKLLPETAQEPEERKRLADPCTGSQYTLRGQYLSGPSPRNLDELSAEMRDGMLWVRGEIIYGDRVRN